VTASIVIRTVIREAQNLDEHRGFTDAHREIVLRGLVPFKSSPSAMRFVFRDLRTRPNRSAPKLCTTWASVTFDFVVQVTGSDFLATPIFLNSPSRSRARGAWRGWRRPCS
jgi:hypothetical protein